MTQIQFLGHTCFLVEFGDEKLLFDPFITESPLAKQIDIDALEVGYVFLTHWYQDHVLDAKAIAKRTGAKIISSYEIVNWYEAKDVPGHAVNHGRKYTFGFETVKYVSAIQSSVLPDGTYGGNPGSFVFWNDSNCFYMAGDTTLTYDMKLIPALCPKLGWAVLPIGDSFTTGMEEAVMAADFIESNQIIGCHCNTFPPIEIEVSKVQQLFEAQKRTLHLPKIGTSLSL